MFELDRLFAYFTLLKHPLIFQFSENIKPWCEKPLHINDVDVQNKTRVQKEVGRKPHMSNLGRIL